MVSSLIVINQVTKSAGVAGTSREDLSTGYLVTLTNSNNTGVLTWQWKMLSRPPTSTAVLSGTTTLAATFTPDVSGSYLIELIVNSTIKSQLIAAVKHGTGLRELAKGESNEFGDWGEVINAALIYIKQTGGGGGGSSFEVNAYDHKTSDRGGSVGYYHEGTIQNALTFIAGAAADLRLTKGTWYIENNLTIPSNVSLNLSKGAIFSISSSKTLTLNCEVNTVPQQIFSGAGSIAGTIKNDHIYPEWWGAKCDWNGTSGTDDTVPLQKALNYSAITARAIYLRSGARLRILYNLCVWGYASIIGENNKTSEIALDAWTDGVHPDYPAENLVAPIGSYPAMPNNYYSLNWMCLGLKKLPVLATRETYSISGEFSRWSGFIKNIKISTTDNAGNPASTYTALTLGVNVIVTFAADTYEISNNYFEVRPTNLYKIFSLFVNGAREQWAHQNIFDINTYFWNKHGLMLNNFVQMDAPSDKGSAILNYVEPTEKLTLGYNHFYGSGDDVIALISANNCIVVGNKCWSTHGRIGGLGGYNNTFVGNYHERIIGMEAPGRAPGGPSYNEWAVGNLYTIYPAGSNEAGDNIVFVGNIAYEPPDTTWNSFRNTDLSTTSGLNVVSSAASYFSAQLVGKRFIILDNTTDGNNTRATNVYVKAIVSPTSISLETYSPTADFNLTSTASNLTFIVNPFNTDLMYISGRNVTVANNVIINDFSGTWINIALKVGIYNAYQAFGGVYNDADDLDGISDQPILSDGIVKPRMVNISGNVSSGRYPGIMGETGNSAGHDLIGPIVWNNNIAPEFYVYGDRSRFSSSNRAWGSTIVNRQHIYGQGSIQTVSSPSATTIEFVNTQPFSAATSQLGLMFVDITIGVNSGTFRATAYNYATKVLTLTTSIGFSGAGGTATVYTNLLEYPVTETCYQNVKGTTISDLLPIAKYKIADIRGGVESVGYLSNGNTRKYLHNSCVIAMVTAEISPAVVASNSDAAVTVKIIKNGASYLINSISDLTLATTDNYKIHDGFQANNKLAAYGDYIEVLATGGQNLMTSVANNGAYDIEVIVYALPLGRRL